MFRCPKKSSSSSSPSVCKSFASCSQVVRKREFRLHGVESAPLGGVLKALSCASCGLRVTAPRPDELEAPHLFEESKRA
eukprot:7903616-Pyramimonas_sp.AAC.1